MSTALPDVTPILLAPDTTTASKLLADLPVSGFLALLEKYVPDADVRLLVGSVEPFVDPADAEIACYGYDGRVPEDEWAAASERCIAALNRGEAALWDRDAPADDRLAAMDFALNTPVAEATDFLLGYLAAEIRGD